VGVAGGSEVLESLVRSSQKVVLSELGWKFIALHPIIKYQRGARPNYSIQLQQRIMYRPTRGSVRGSTKESIKGLTRISQRSFKKEGVNPA
jgi:hypothetical protein